jgi:hypothetical protein
MQKNLLAAACLAAFTTAATAGANTLLFEDFEDDTVTYTLNQTEFSDGSGDYFTRTDGSNIAGSVNFTNVQGTSFFAAQDIDGDGTNPGVQTFSLSIAGFQNLAFSAFFAEDDDGSDQDWDDTDFVHVDYQIDGGGYLPLFWLENDGSTFNTAPLVDTDFDGIGDGAEITDAFTSYSASIPGIGSILDLRFTYSLDSGDEDIAVDNISITGTVIPEPLAVGGAALLGVVGLLRRRHG